MLKYIKIPLLASSSSKGLRKDKGLLVLFFICMLLCSTACKKFVEIDPPKTDLVKSTVFENDGTARAAIATMYAQLVNSYASGSVQSVSYLSGISSDELQNYNNNTVYTEFATNTLTPLNSSISALWSASYQSIFNANGIIEGLNRSTGVTVNLKRQLLGEALFVRAFSHFYLVNLFGDAPLVLTTDYRVNANIPRTTKSDVYKQIISDLKEAKDLLAADYSFSTNERTRVNKYAASALLARAYLFTGDYTSAESEASFVINKTDLYQLPALDQVFLKNNNEAIWQLIRDAGNTNDATTFLMTSSQTVPANAALPNAWVQTFGLTDGRRSTWIGTKISGANTYYYPAKYKNTAVSPITEYTNVLRLAEQFLLRAEARLRQNKLTGANSAASDINIVRSRAGLGGTVAVTAGDLQRAIEDERRFELFSEWGHRWLDLKRWPSETSPNDATKSRADDILNGLKPNWSVTKKLYPIPQGQILNDPAMANQQNPGYN